MTPSRAVLARPAPPRKRVNQLGNNDVLPIGSIGAVPAYPDVPTYRMIFGGLHVWEGDGWKDESMSWKTGAYVAANLTGPMEMTYRGPGAQDLLSSLSINNVHNWPIGKSKHLVMADENGLIASHGLAVRDDEETFRQMAALPWPAYQLAKNGGYDVDVSVRNIFILQVAGPTSLQILEKVLDRDLRDVAFLDIRTVEIADVEIDIELSRIGMVGTLAYELRGPFEAGPAVYDAVYRAGKDLGIKRLGWRTYAVNHTEGGFPQVNCTFLPSLITDESFMAEFGGGNLDTTIGGSVDPADLRARFRTPAEVNWDWMAKFDHDFLGQAAVEAERAAPRRKTVILRWNHDDVLDVFASHFRPGAEYKHIEFPCAPPQLAGGHGDLVTKNDVAVGVSSAAVYSYYYREMLSQTVLDLDQAQIGNEVILHWGDHGGRIKEIRATVERFPYLDLPGNRDYDISTVPSRSAVG